jgi:hypothetical protein
MRQEKRDFRVRGHEFQAVFGKLRIQRQVDSAAFEQGEEADDRIE